MDAASATQPTLKKRHAVPQHVLGVEFKLIGEFTLKQFGILLAGVILAFILFKSPLPAILRIPLALISLIISGGVAFVPIQDRSMGSWLVNFLKTMYSPTQWVWKKEKELPYLFTKTYTLQTTKTTPVQVKEGRKRLQAYLKKLNPEEEKIPLDLQREKRLAAIPLGPKPTLTPTLPASIPTPPLPPTPLPTEERITSLTKKLEVLKQKSEGKKGKKPDRQLKAGIDYYKSQLDQTRKQNEKLQREIRFQRELGKRNEELINLQKQYQTKVEVLQKKLDQAREADITEKKLLAQENRIKELEEEIRGKSTPAVVTAPSIPPSIKIALPNPQRPNVISGVVSLKDGKLAEGAVVLVKDESHDPVRALKTNQLGQFEITTPLLNGSYFVSTKVPGQVFDIMKIELEGKIAEPLFFKGK